MNTKVKSFIGNAKEKYKKENKLIVCGSILLLIDLILFITGTYKDFDLLLHNLCVDLNSDTLSNIFYFFTRILETAMILIPIVIAIYLMYRKKCFNNLLPISIAIAFTEGFGFIVKKIVKRPRPLEIDRPLINGSIVKETGFSFPSMHSFNATMIFGIVILLLLKKYKNSPIRNILIGVIAIIIFMIGLSRVYVYVHYPTDVIAGFAFGLITLGLLKPWIK